MATKRHKPEEIASKLRQVDVLVGQGQAEYFDIISIARFSCSSSRVWTQRSRPPWSSCFLRVVCMVFAHH